MEHQHELRFQSAWSLNYLHKLKHNHFNSLITTAKTFFHSCNFTVDVQRQCSSDESNCQNQEKPAPLSPKRTECKTLEYTPLYNMLIILSTQLLINIPVPEQLLISANKAQGQEVAPRRDGESAFNRTWGPFLETKRRFVDPTTNCHESTANGKTWYAQIKQGRGATRCKPSSHERHMRAAQCWWGLTRPKQLSMATGFWAPFSCLFW